MKEFLKIAIGNIGEDQHDAQPESEGGINTPVDGRHSDQIKIFVPKGGDR
ncbi:hypothetical protein SDC9_186350 [bioreactor metagenome]|uniref:Uncharacterized protein n=1 Tax=bioreactor metagenome TaxID=1076179 RepID=A0A645HIJ0_9ZZZZ